MYTQRYRGLAVIFIFAILCAGGMNGCKSKETKVHNRTLEGTITSVDPASRIVSMNAYIEKLGQSKLIPGKLADDAEIDIDGKLADITQLREGDQISVDGYQKGEDIIALRVSVIRAGGKRITIKPQTTTTTPTDQE
jgi:hypothetical protein